jgi:hypothetical protein
MRTTAGIIVNPCKFPEIYVKSISAQCQSNGRRAGLKIRSPQGGVGSSPNFGTNRSKVEVSLRSQVDRDTEPLKKTPGPFSIPWPVPR